MTQNLYVKRFEVHIVSFFPHLSAIMPPRTVPGIVAASNSVAEIEFHYIVKYQKFYPIWQFLQGIILKYLLIWNFLVPKASGAILACQLSKIVFLLRSQDASSSVIFIWSSEFFSKAKITADVIALLTEKLADDRQTHIDTNTCIWKLNKGNLDILPLIIHPDLIPNWFHVFSLSICKFTTSTFVT